MKTEYSQLLDEIEVLKTTITDYYDAIELSKYFDKRLESITELDDSRKKYLSYNFLNTCEAMFEAPPRRERIAHKKASHNNISC